VVDPFAAKAVRAAYDAVADDYETEFADDLERLPVDRAVLDAGAEQLVGRGPVLDLGCGPGQVGGYLAARGVEVIGVDVSEGMLTVARRRIANLSLARSDMRSLPFRSRSCSGVVAFYSVQHLPRAAIGELCSELRRVLAPGGIVILATHLGEGEVYVDDFLGYPIAPVGGTLYSDRELETALLSHSLVVEDARFRDPLPHEHQSKRVYLTARLSER
jgi:SAM-dependent methyltransferase